MMHRFARMATGIAVAFGVSGGLALPSAEAQPARQLTPPTCTDSWKTAASGQWSVAANWSTGAVPTSSDNACITVAGTYTVTLTDGYSVSTLTLGGPSGTQTLSIQAPAGHNAQLTLSATPGSDVGPNGVLQLDSLAGGGTATLGGGSTATLTNDGVFATLDASSNQDYIRANLTNDAGGTVTIGGASTVQDSGTTTVNGGSMTVTASGALSVTGGSVITNNGTVTDTGSITLNNSTWNQNGAESGNTVALFNSSTLADTSGAGSFSLTDTENLSGTIPSGQTVNVLALSGHNADAVLAATVVNNGTLLLSMPSPGGSAQLSGAGSLTNNGSFQTSGSANTVYVRVNVTSAGSVTINGTDTRQDSNTTFTNNGTFTVGSGATYAVSSSGSVFTDNGTVADNGALTLNNATWNQNGGSETGNAVALSNGSTLADAVGAGSFNLTDTDTLSGTIPAGQTVTGLALPGHNVDVVLAAGGVTDNGTLALTIPTGGGSPQMTGGLLTDNGTFSTGGTGNTVYIRANVTVTATGAVTIGATDTRQDSNTTTVNNGTFTVNSGDTFAVSSGSSVFTNNGTVADNGSLTLNDATWNQNGGSETGNTVALLNSSALADASGTGSFSLTDNAYLSGTIPAGQTVTGLAVPGHNANVVLAGPGVSNNGTLSLAIPASGGSPQVSGGTLTNNGTFSTTGTGNTVYVRANITNAATGAVSIGSTDTRQDSSTTTLNNGTFTVGSGVTYAVSGSATVFTNNATVADNGSLTLNNSTWNQNSGSESGNAVALFNSSSLADAAGTGSFNLIDNAYLSGTIPAGQTVTGLPLPGHNANVVLPVAGVTNNGTLALTVPSGGGSVQLSGGPLANNGNLSTNGSSNGSYLRVTINNAHSGVITVNSSNTHQDSNTVTTNDGLLSVTDGANLTLSSSSSVVEHADGTLSGVADATNGGYGITISGGSVALAGTLAVTTVGTPTLGQTFNIVGGTGVSGSFSGYSFGAHAYDVAVSATAVTLTTATPFTLAGKAVGAKEDLPFTNATVATFTAGSQTGPVYAATINWGDGSATAAGTVSGTKITGSHQYTSTGTFTITTTLQDQLGTFETVTSTATVTVAPAPTVTAVSPTPVVRAKSVTLTVTGTNFTTNSTVAFSASGVTTNSVTWVSATKLTVKVTLSASATIGAGNVTVTTPGGSGICTGCFTIDALPTIGSISAPLVPGTATTVTVKGTGFQSGLAVTTNITGAVVGSITSVTATSFKVVITAPSGTPAGSTYQLKVTNPDGGAATFKKLNVS
jgi:hypothetical protein